MHWDLYVHLNREGSWSLCRENVAPLPCPRDSRFTFTRARCSTKPEERTWRPPAHPWKTSRLTRGGPLRSGVGAFPRGLEVQRQARHRGLGGGMEVQGTEARLLAGALNAQTAHLHR